MDNQELKDRTKLFARGVIGIVRAMPEDRVATPIANQLIRSGTSVAANYRAACFAKSRPDFINKLKICIEEVDESAHWMELIMEEGILPEIAVQYLHGESMELLAIFLSSVKTARDDRG